MSHPNIRIRREQPGKQQLRLAQLELQKETVQDLTDSESEAAQGACDAQAGEKKLTGSAVLAYNVTLVLLWAGGKAVFPGRS